MSFKKTRSKMTTICPVCESDRINIFYDYGHYTLLNCRACDLVFRDKLNSVNVYDLVAEVYNPAWIAMREEWQQNTFLELAAFGALLLRIFAPDKGDLLEIGPGTGEFLYLARATGWNVTGIEASPLVCDYARAKFGLNLYNGVWDPIMIGKKKFHAVAFWHVLEHMPDPVRFLKEVASVLKPEGLLFFSLPNKNSLTNTVHGPLSRLYREVDHLFHYSAENLTMLLAKASLEAVTLFSRFPNTIEDDKISFEEMMARLAQLQGNMRGEELCCVAKKRG